MIENKFTDEAEEILFKAYPEAAPAVTEAKNKRLKNGITRCPMDFNAKQKANLKRARELLSHTMPNATNADLISYLMDSPKKTSKAQTRRNVIIFADGTCTYKDPRAGHVCGSRNQIEIDRIKPKAIGGNDSPENLRVLCRRHNIMMA